MLSPLDPFFVYALIPHSLFFFFFICLSPKQAKNNSIANSTLFSNDKREATQECVVVKYRKAAYVFW